MHICRKINLLFLICSCEIFIFYFSLSSFRVFFSSVVDSCQCVYRREPLCMCIYLQSSETILYFSLYRRISQPNNKACAFFPSLITILIFSIFHSTTTTGSLSCVGDESVQDSDDEIWEMEKLLLVRVNRETGTVLWNPLSRTNYSIE